MAQGCIPVCRSDVTALQTRMEGRQWLTKKTSPVVNFRGWWQEEADHHRGGRGAVARRRWRSVFPARRREEVPADGAVAEEQVPVVEGRACLPQVRSWPFVVNLPPGGPAEMLQIVARGHDPGAVGARYPENNDPMIRHHFIEPARIAAVGGADDARRKTGAAGRDP